MGCSGPEGGGGMEGTDNLLAVNGLEAQQSVIGSMLIDSSCVGAVMAAVKDSDFTDSACRNTFAAIRRLFLARRPIDPVILQDEVHGGDRWVAWARKLMELTPTAANVLAYCDIVRRQAILYQLRDKAGQVLSAVSLEDTRRLVREMSGLLVDDVQDRKMTAAELAQDFIRRVTSKDKPEYLPWGIPTADRTVYAERGDLILLGGYPSAGKTLLSVQMALAQAKRYRVGYYSLETRPEKMADRLFAHLAKVSLSNIKQRDLTDDQLGQLAEAANHFVAHCPVDYFRAAGWTVDDISASAIANDYQIIYIDYLQLVEGKERSAYERVSAVSRGLKLFAQNTGTAVVALAQLNRPEKVNKAGKQVMVPPSMQSFRESGQIEQDADAAFLLWASDPNDNKSQRVLKLGKNKEGQKFSRYLSFDGATQTMVEVATEGSASVAAEMSAAGRAARAENRRKAREAQMSFRELTDEEAGENPFEPEEDLP